MKILISAYSCEPNSGSEHEIGWSWIKALSKNKNNKITIITRESNKKKIYLENTLCKKKNVNFWFYDLPDFFLKILKKKNKKNNYIYFYLWQLLVYFRFKSKINKIKYDFIHHVTFSSLRIPSFLFLCKSNFFFGPVCGGEIIKNCLIKDFSLKAKIIEYLRLISNFYIKYSPLMNLLFLKSKKIILTHEVNLSLVPKIFHKKVVIVPSIFNDEIFFKNKIKKNYNIYFAGRLLEWKGAHYLIKIFKKLYKANNKINLEIFGDGPLKAKIIDDVKNEVFKNNIKLYGLLPQSKFLKKIKKSDLLIFPTLRDSGGYVILDALNNNINVLTTNAPGPMSIIKKNELGYIDIYNNNETEIVNQFKKKILNFYKLKQRRVNVYLHDDINSMNKVYKIYSNNEYVRKSNF